MAIASDAVRGLAALLLAVMPALAAADYDVGPEPEPVVTLTVKPILCIVDKRSPHCDMSFLVIWQSDRSGYYCLFNDLETAALRCWSDERTGQLTEARTVLDEFRYWMTERGDDKRLAPVTVEVLRVDDGDRRRKRRSRHVWDLF